MGLGTNEDITYLNVSDGKLRQRVDANTEGAKNRSGSVNGKDYSVWELVYPSVDGYIKSIAYREHDTYGNSWNVKLQDSNGEIFMVSLKEKSNYFQRFAELLPNIDFSKPVVLKPYSIPIKGKEYKNQGLTVEQGGSKLASYYKTWDSKTEKTTLKNGMEDFNFAKADGKDERDILKIKLIKFLRAETDKQIERLVDYLDTAPATPSNSDEGDDDLPF